MVDGSAMETFEARLASFKVVYPALKKRGSHSKGTKSVKWPHKSPMPAQLAEAGFFYHPTDGSPDNTTCFLCHSHLAGWEPGDNPIVEHLKHAPECGWAINVAIELEMEDGCNILENQSYEYLLNARIMTYGTNWPHENKRGWTCKIRKMAASGWFYCSTPDSDDYVRCAYCNLSMDGWEPKDDPYLAHHDRSSDCKFFKLSAPANQRSGRPRKSRASKASRMSTQSTFTVVSEGGSNAEAEINEDSNLVVSAIDGEQSSKSTIRGKKGGKPRKASAKTKARALNTTPDEAAQASSFVEPEDDDFEVKIEKEPTRKDNSRKRKSDEMNENNDVYHPNLITPELDLKPPPAKRRTTRASSHAMQADLTSNISVNNDHENELDVNGVESMLPTRNHASKKGTQKNVRKAKKGLSSGVRKASATSTASAGSSKGLIPSDEALDAALEADLDRPLTDNEAEVGQPEIQYPKIRRLTRTRPGSRNLPPSIAPEHSTTGLSSPAQRPLDFGQQDPMMQITSGNAGGVGCALQGEAEGVLQNGLHMQDTQPVRLFRDLPAEKEHDLSTELKLVSGKSKKTVKSRQPSRQVPKRNAHPLIPSPAAESPVAHRNLITSDLGAQAVEDGSGNETDVSVLGKGSTKRGGKKNKAALMNRKPEKAIIREDENAFNLSEPVLDPMAIDLAEKAGPMIPSHDIKIAPSVDMELVELVEPLGIASTSKTSLRPRKSAKSSKGSQSQTPIKSPIALQYVDKSPRTPNASPSQRECTLLLASPVAANQAHAPPAQTTPPPAASPQSSDVENQPPSSRPSSARPPLMLSSPLKTQMTRIPLVTTPTTSPFKRNISRLQSTIPWSAIDYDKIFLGSPGKENHPFALKPLTEGEMVVLTSPEKSLSVEEWIQFNAQRGEKHLRSECERVIGKFEGEGVRALKTLEGITCVD